MTVENGEWAESKSKERQSQNFVKTALELSGYKVMDYGIENHNMDIVKEIRGSYVSKTNHRIFSMPDFVVIEPETKKTELLEVKFRTIDYFNWKKTTFLFGYRNIKDYIDYWIDATIVIVMEVKPYCLCVRVSDIDWNNNFKEKLEMKNGSIAEVWNFTGKYKLFNDIFPLITNKHFMKALHLSKIKVMGKEDKERSKKK